MCCQGRIIPWECYLCSAWFAFLSRSQPKEMSSSMERRLGSNHSSFLHISTSQLASWPPPSIPFAKHKVHKHNYYYSIVKEMENNSVMTQNQNTCAYSHRLLQVFSYMYMSFLRTFFEFPEFPQYMDKRSTNTPKAQHVGYSLSINLKKKAFKISVFYCYTQVKFLLPIF